MKLLSNYNYQLQQQREALERDRYKTGVACDDCMTELLFSDDMILACHPPKRNIHCPNCKFKGYMG